MNNQPHNTRKNNCSCVSGNALKENTGKQLDWESHYRYQPVNSGNPDAHLNQFTVQPPEHINTRNYHSLKGPDGITNYQDPYQSGIHIRLNRQKLPSVRNGMLSFRNDDHFDDYMKYVNDLVDRSSNLNSRIIYEKIENELGFRSLRKAALDLFELQSEQGWKNVQDIPELHFISDSLLKSVLSPSAELSVGDLTTRFINENVAVSVANNDQHMLTMARNLPYSVTRNEVESLQMQYPNRFLVENWKQTTVETTYNFPDQPPIFSTFDGSRKIDPNELQVFNQNNFGGIGQTKRVINTGVQLNNTKRDTRNIGLKNVEGYSISTLTKIVIGGDCANQYKVTIDDLQLYYGTSLKDAKFRIFWGDSSPIETVYTSSKTVSPSHTYDFPGNYTIMVEAFEVGAGTTFFVLTHLFYAGVGCAAGISKESDVKEAIRPDGYRMVRGKCWIKQWTRRAGNKMYAKTGAYTEAFHWERSSKRSDDWEWRIYKDAKSIKVEYWIARYYTHNCEKIEVYNRAKVNTGGLFVKDLRVETEYTHDGHYGWTTMASEHTMVTDDGQPNVFLKIDIYPCP